MKRQEFTFPQQYLVGDIKVNTEAQLDRTYLRLLLDAFVPYQEAILAYLDELMTKHDPQLVEKQLKDIEKQSKKKSREWEQAIHQFSQADQAEQEKIIGRVEDIHNEQTALRQTDRELLETLNLETRSQDTLQRKRENILKLLQKRQDMIEEGTWEKVGGKDKMSSVFSLMGDESYGFGF